MCLITAGLKPHKRQDVLFCHAQCIHTAGRQDSRVGGHMSTEHRETFALFCNTSCTHLLKPRGSNK